MFNNHAISIKSLEYTAVKGTEKQMRHPLVAKEYPDEKQNFINEAALSAVLNHLAAVEGNEDAFNKLAHSVLKYSEEPAGEIVIADGWGSDRMTFKLVFAVAFGPFETIETITGYVDSNNVHYPQRLVVARASIDTLAVIHARGHGSDDAFDKKGRLDLQYPRNLINNIQTKDAFSSSGFTDFTTTVDLRNTLVATHMAWSPPTSIFSYVASWERIEAVGDDASTATKEDYLGFQQSLNSTTTVSSSSKPLRYILPDARIPEFTIETVTRAFPDFDPLTIVKKPEVKSTLLANKTIRHVLMNQSPSTAMWIREFINIIESECVSMDKDTWNITISSANLLNPTIEMDDGIYRNPSDRKIIMVQLMGLFREMYYEPSTVELHFRPNGNSEVFIIHSHGDTVDRYVVPTFAPGLCSPLITNDHGSPMKIADVYDRLVASQLVNS